MNAHRKTAALFGAVLAATIGVGAAQAQTK